MERSHRHPKGFISSRFLLKNIETCLAVVCAHYPKVYMLIAESHQVPNLYQMETLMVQFTGKTLHNCCHKV